MAPECGGCRSIAFPDYQFSPIEFEVCEILLQLPNLIAESEFYSRGLSTWGRKQKRSALNSTLPPSGSGCGSLSSPPSSLPESAAVVSPPGENDGPPLKKVKELSPTTPLSVHSLTLSLSESDENAKRSKKKVSLKKKAEWLKDIDELTKRKELLEGELETVKRYYDNLKAVNSELKAKKKEMILDHKNNESTQPEGGSSSTTTMEINQQPPVKSSSTLETEQHQPQPQPPIKNQTPPPPTIEPSQAFQTPFGKVPSYEDTMGPIGIPDLNVSLEELTHRNYNKIIAAQARQNRIRIWKTKNSNSTTKMQCR